MKKNAVVFCLLVICLNFTVSFAQSRRVPPSENGKINRRDPQPAASPTPITEQTASPSDAQTPVDDGGETIRVDNRTRHRSR